VRAGGWRKVSADGGRLRGLGLQPRAATEGRVRKARPKSAEGRARIAEATRKRWAAFRAEKAAKAK